MTDIQPIADRLAHNFEFISKSFRFSTRRTWILMECSSSMGWLRLVGSLKLQVSFAKEPYKRDHILQKRPIILRRLLVVATPIPCYSLVLIVNLTGRILVRWKRFGKNLKILCHPICNRLKACLGKKSQRINNALFPSGCHYVCHESLYCPDLSFSEEKTKTWNNQFSASLYMNRENIKWSFFDLFFFFFVEQLIKRGQYTMPSPYWDDVSEVQFWKML